MKFFKWLQGKVQEQKQKPEDILENITLVPNLEIPEVKDVLATAKKDALKKVISKIAITQLTEACYTPEEVKETLAAASVYKQGKQSLTEKGIKGQELNEAHSKLRSRIRKIFPNAIYQPTRRLDGFLSDYDKKEFILKFDFERLVDKLTEELYAEIAETD